MTTVYLIFTTFLISFVIGVIIGFLMYYYLI